jgi:hypothetical protein
MTLIILKIKLIIEIEMSICVRENTSDLHPLQHVLLVSLIIVFTFKFSIITYVS